MILCIDNVLTPEDLEKVAAGLADATFVDGASSAGWHARRVKANLQMKAQGNGTGPVADIVTTALRRHVLFRMAILPRHIRPILFNRYEARMEYGSHVDDALMGGDNPVRSDVSLTLFLSDPSSYEGGELVIETAAGEQPYKLGGGAVILYPSTALHRVAPVRRGVRLAAVTWVQSAVRDAAKREILFDLDTARRTMFEQYGKTREFDLLSKTHANLLRLWAEI